MARLGLLKASLWGWDSVSGYNKTAGNWWWDVKDTPAKGVG